MSRVAAMPRDPILDPEFAEELAHAHLHGMGVTSLRTFWIATLIARACVWTNAYRLAGEREPRGARAVLMSLRREMERELLAFHLGRGDGSNPDQTAWRRARLNELDGMQLPGLEPPFGWRVS